ncbi:MAG: Phosphate transport system permease protein PstC [Planctomycetota bacterium]
MSEPTFTGWVRRRTTSVRVKVADAVARTLITTAGIATIIAVVGMCVFLVAVAVPLFLPGSVEPRNGSAALLGAQGAPPRHVALDEHETIGLAVFPDGEVSVFEAATGRELERRTLFGDDTPTAMSFAPTGGEAIFGFADGTLRYGSLGFEPEFVEPSRIEPEYRGLAVGEAKPRGAGVVERTPAGAFRTQRFVAKLSDPVRISDAPIQAVDVSMLPSGPILAAVDAERTFHVKAVTIIRNLMTRKETIRATGGSMELPAEIAGGRPPDHCLLEGRADSAILVWDDGRALRLDTRDRGEPRIAERFSLLDRDDATITSIGFMIGKTTLLVGDSSGSLQTWFRVRPSDEKEAAKLVDGSRLVLAHVLPGGPGASVTSLASSSRTRMAAAGFGDGSSRLYYVTNDRLLAECPPQDGQRAAISAIAISPKDDGLLTASKDGFFRWGIDIPHPQTTLGSIFGKVWYEGYEKPEHVWQSSSGTDDFEPKFGLVPLIFGSIKATFYAMLFGTPLAILAAIYTSEYLHPKSRARIKPAIEIMASLPSVVLGFLAALVFAPFVERAVPAILAAFVAVPFAVLVGAHLWQFVPTARANRLAAWRVPLAMLFAALGVAGGFVSGPWIERLLFGGDIMGWLSWKPTGPGPQDSPFESPVGGWVLLLLPIASIVSWWFVSLVMGGARRDAIARLGRGAAAMAQLAKFLGGTGLCLGLTFAIASVLSTMGFDPRGSVVDTYVQRNALIVGFLMGFAVIPIIYTIAEDALSSVPEHLRSASLGLGATPWQTAVRIVVPTAMSGIFSAVMVGLGRAVGETMIVLMAAGNTPIMQWNVFNGFRTLSANIAVELPEAVQHSTEYRMLFLAGLSLFVLTFLVNSLAEAVRQRFRKRAIAL